MPRLLPTRWPLWKKPDADYDAARDIAPPLAGRAMSIAEVEEQNLDHDISAVLSDRAPLPLAEMVVYTTSPDPIERSPFTNKAPNDKLSTPLAKRLQGAAGSEVIEVLVGLPPTTRMTRLPVLDRTVPRSHPANEALLRTRRNMVAAVARERRQLRAPAMAHVESFGHPVLEEFVHGNGVRLELSVNEIRELAEDPGILSISEAHHLTPPPNVAWGRAALGSDLWRFFGFDGNLSGLYLGLIDTGVRSSVVSFSGSSAGQITFQKDCVYGNNDCNDTGNNLYDPLDPWNGHGTASGNIINGGISSQAGWGDPIKGISQVEMDTFNTLNHGQLLMSGTDPAAVARAIYEAEDVGDSIIVAVVQSQEPFDGMISTAADDIF